MLTRKRHHASLTREDWRQKLAENNGSTAASEAMAAIANKAATNALTTSLQKQAAVYIPNAGHRHYQCLH